MNYIELWVKIDIYTRIIGFSLLLVVLLVLLVSAIIKWKKK